MSNRQSRRKRPFDLAFYNRLKIAHGPSRLNLLQDDYKLDPKTIRDFEATGEITPTSLAHVAEFYASKTNLDIGNLTSLLWGEETDIQTKTVNSKYLSRDFWRVVEQIDNELSSKLEQLNPSESSFISMYQHFLTSAETISLLNSYLGASDCEKITNHLIEIAQTDEFRAGLNWNILEIDLTKGVNNIVFETKREPIQIPEAELVWDCVCHSKKDGHKNLKCRIHDDLPVQQSRILDVLFDHSLALFKLPENTLLLWNELDKSWPPSVDTLFFLDVLESEHLDERDISSVLDLGAGTGALGISVSNKLGNVEKLVLSDWSLTGVIHSSLNLGLNQISHGDVRWGTGWEILNEQEQFDLVVCNPPYIPGPHTMSPVLGTALMEHFLLSVKKYTKLAYLNCSSVADELITNIGSEVTLTPIASKWIPFRVKEVFTEGLLERFLGNGVEKTSKYGRHRYYHKITIYRID